MTINLILPLKLQNNKEIGDRMLDEIQKVYQ